MLSIVRVVAALAIVGAAVYAVGRLSLAPLRCAGAATVGAAGLDRIEFLNDHTKYRSARAIAGSLDGCDCLSPARSRILAVRAAAFGKAGDHKAAVATYEQILALDRRPEIYFALGLSHLAAFDRAAALDSFERACEFDPKRLRKVPYDELREEVERRLVARHGAHWVR
jgi:tetratricopeptide (TPR) repeat protein